MQVTLEKLLNDCGVQEPVYPGKRLVQKMPQPGEFKSHSMVWDWRVPDLLHIELRAGMSGKALDNKTLSKYPVTFQAPTYLDIDTSNTVNDDTEDEEEEGGGETSGKKGKSGGGGGKKPGVASLAAFTQVVEGKIPTLGEIKKMVVMGKEIAQTAFEGVLNALTAQISALKISPTDLVAEGGETIKKATPGGGLEAKGNESINYEYNPHPYMFGVGGPS